MTKLYIHENTAHHPQSVTVEDTREKFSKAGINARVAVTLTRVVGSMPTAYLFIVLALCGLLAILGILSPIVALLVAWLSQTFIQLVLLPVIMVGQNVLSKHSELVTEETAKNTRALLHQILQVAKHLSAQDEELLKQTADVQRLYSLVEAIDVRLTATAKTTVPKRPV